MDEILPFTTTWMNLEGIMLSDISQTETDKYSMLSLICGVQKIKQMYMQKRNTLTDIENKLVVTSGEREGRRGKIEIWN